MHLTHSVPINNETTLPTTTHQKVQLSPSVIVVVESSSPSNSKTELEVECAAIANGTAVVTNQEEMMSVENFVIVTNVTLENVGRALVTHLQEKDPSIFGSTPLKQDATDRSIKSHHLCRLEDKRDIKAFYCK